MSAYIPGGPLLDAARAQAAALQAFKAMRGGRVRVGGTHRTEHGRCARKRVDARASGRLGCSPSVVRDATSEPRCRGRVTRRISSRTSPRGSCRATVSRIRRWARVDEPMLQMLTATCSADAAKMRS